MGNSYLDVVIMKMITYSGDNKPEQTPQRSPSQYRVVNIKTLMFK